jgi:hypothetical protein
MDTFPTPALPGSGAQRLIADGYDLSPYFGAPLN